jgi:hypothetical protein
MVAQRRRLEAAFGPAFRAWPQRHGSAGGNVALARPAPTRAPPAQAVAQREVNAPEIVGGAERLALGGLGRLGRAALWGLGGALVGAVAAPALAAGLAAAGVGALAGVAGLGAAGWGAAAGALSLGAYGAMTEDGDDVASHGTEGSSDDGDGASWGECGVAPEACGLPRDASFSATAAKRALEVRASKGAKQRKPTAQLAHVAGDSGPKDYNSHWSGAVSDVLFRRDAAGYIDFTQPSVDGGPHGAGTTWTPHCDAASDDTCIADPLDPTKLNLLVGMKNVVSLRNSTRAQHFRVANRIRFGTTSDRSPDGYTWHHKLANGMMVLVDRMVHKKHGHNGGKLLW